MLLQLPYAVKGDLSPEELRWEAYREIQHTGACVHYTQRIQALRAEAQRKKELIIDLLWKPKVLIGSGVVVQAKAGGGLTWSAALVDCQEAL